MLNSVSRNGRHAQSITGQVREILKHFPDASLQDVEHLVEVPRGMSQSSIAPAYSNVVREVGRRSARRRVKNQHQSKSLTKGQITTAIKLLNQTGSLKEAISVLRTVAAIADCTKKQMT